MPGSGSQSGILRSKFMPDCEPQPAPVHFDYPSVAGRTEVVIVGAVTYNGDIAKNYVVSYNDWCVYDDARIATEEEKTLLLMRLCGDAERLDAENKRIIEYKWKLLKRFIALLCNKYVI